MNAISKLRYYSVIFTYIELLEFSRAINEILSVHVIDPLPYLPTTSKALNETDASSTSENAQHISGFFLACIACSKEIPEAKQLILEFIARHSVNPNAENYVILRNYSINQLG